MTQTWPTVRILLKWAGIVVGTVALLALLLLGVAFLVNRHDEPLTARTEALLRLPTDALRPEDNIYVALQGLDAAPGRSVIDVGEARIERYNASVDAVLRDPTPAKLAALRARDPDHLDFKGDITFLQPLVGSVWTAALVRVDRPGRKPWAAPWTGSFSAMLRKTQCWAAFRVGRGAQMARSPPPRFGITNRR